MHDVTITFEDFTQLPSDYAIVGNDLCLKISGSVYPTGNQLYKLPSKFQVSDILTLNPQGDDLADIYLFPVIDGASSYYSTVDGTWKPLTVADHPALYPDLGMPLSALDMAKIDKIFDDGRQHQIGLGLVFGSNGTATSLLHSFQMTYRNVPNTATVSFTRVYGSVPVRTGFPTVSRFRIKASRPSVVYGNTVIPLGDVEVPVAADGSWEAYLPDTESMSDLSTSYGFYFSPVCPVFRRVPKLVEVEWGALPLSLSL